METIINQKKTLLVAIYTPNNNLENFYQKLYTQIAEKKPQYVCLLGDFNAIADERLDYKKGNKSTTGRRKLPKIFFQMVEELELKDIG